MTSFIRSLCLAALLAAGSAWAQQQQVDNPDNPHSTKAKDKAGQDVPSSATNQQTDQAETANPHHPDYRNNKPTGDASKQSIDASERGNPNDPQYRNREKTTMQGSGAGMDQDHAQAHAAMMNASPQQQLQMLHATNLHEIEMAQLAQKNGSDRVKTFAQTLLRDHQDADKQVQDLAKRKGFTLSDTPKDPKMQQHKQMEHDRLSSLQGAQFDRTFAHAMVMGHQRAISLVQNWTQSCKDQDVCNLETQLMPKLQQHLQTAEQLRGAAPMPQGRAPDSR